MCCIFVFIALARTSPDGGAALARLLHKHSWIGYDPIAFDPVRSPNPSRESIGQDLRRIRNAGFTGIVTYSSQGGLSLIPPLASQEDLAVIMGVWDPTDTEECERAALQSRHVAAYHIGHNGFTRDYFINDLQNAIAILKRKSGRPVTTMEPVRFYEDDPKLVELGDWLFPDIALSLQDMPGNYPDVNLTRDLAKFSSSARALATSTRAKGRPVMFKITYPWSGAKGATLETQERFFAPLLASLDNPEFGLPVRVSIMAHGAFDSLWKKGYYHPGSYKSHTVLAA